MLKNCSTLWQLTLNFRVSKICIWNQVVTSLNSEYVMYPGATLKLLQNCIKKNINAVYVGPLLITLVVIIFPCNHTVHCQPSPKQAQVIWKQEFVPLSVLIYYLSLLLDFMLQSFRTVFYYLIVTYWLCLVRVSKMMHIFQNKGKLMGSTNYIIQKIVYIERTHDILTLKKAWVLNIKWKMC